ncbi:MAG: alpha/beta hydrolase [Sphingobacteriales bacterium]|nr:alpha/beta hydrolase [Sphingobacteriales bacterium]
MKKLIRAGAFIGVLLIIAFFALQKKAIPLEELKSKYANEHSQFLDMDGMKVHYRIEGEGKPIVLIHGTGACLQTWDGWTDSLTAHGFKVIRLDMPAFGLTGPRKDNDYSIRMYVEFLDEFLSRHQIDTFAIAGNSLGGEIAWCYAVAHPEKVNNLILVDPAGFYSKDKGNKAIVFKLAKIKWLAALMAKIDTKVIVDKTVKDVYEDDSKIKKETIQMYYDMSMREGNRESFSARVQQIDSEKHPDISTIQIPTLILWGKQDKLIDVSMADNFIKIPHSKLVVYDGVGHSPQEEIPAKSAEDVMSFIQNNQSKN